MRKWWVGLTALLYAATFSAATPGDNAVSTAQITPELRASLTRDYEIIHACDLDTLIPAILVKLIKRVRLCYTLFDVYADNLPSRTPERLRTLVASVERRGIEFADYLFVVNEFQRNQLDLRRSERLECIYNTPEDLGSASARRGTPGVAAAGRAPRQPA